MSLDVQDWTSNLDLRTCSHAEKGVLVDVMCLMHVSPEYGVLRIPLAAIAKAISAEEETLRALVRKGLIKGQHAAIPDQDLESKVLPFIYRASHAGQLGEPTTLIESCTTDLWFIERMVVAAHKRRRASAAARQAGRVVPAHKGFGEAEKQTAGAHTRAKRQAPNCPYDELATSFLEHFPHAPRPRMLGSDSRLGQAIASLWRRHATAGPDEFKGYGTREEGIAKWSALFAHAKLSEFLRGEAPPRQGGTPFQISLDWLMTPKHIELVINGFYHRGAPTSSISHRVSETARSVADAVARRNGAAHATDSRAVYSAQASIF